MNTTPKEDSSNHLFSFGVSESSLSSLNEPCTCLLPVHSKADFGMGCVLEIESYSKSLRERLISPLEAADFWREGHYLSCLRRSSILCTPKNVKSDFHDNNGFRVLESNVVNESLSVLLANLNRFHDSTPNSRKCIINPSRKIELFESICVFKPSSIEHSEKSLQSSSFFSKVLSNLSFTLGSSVDDRSCINDAATKIGRLFEIRVSTTVNAAGRQSTSKGKDRKAVVDVTSTVTKPRKVATALANGFTKLLAAFDIVDDLEYTKSIQQTTLPPQEISFDGKADDDLILQKILDNPIADDAIVLSVELAVDCCELIIKYVKKLELTKDTYLCDDYDEETPYLVVRGKIMMYTHQQNTMTNSAYGAIDCTWLNFCKYVGHNLSKVQDKEQLDYYSDSKLIFQAQAHLLSKINQFDADLLLLSLREASFIEHAKNMEDAKDLSNIIAISTEKSNLSRVSPDETEVALFQLVHARKSLSVRIEKLQNGIEKAKELSLQYYKQKKKSLALTQLKKRNMMQSQLEQSSNMFLNIETTLEALHESLTNVEIMNVLQHCKVTMKKLQEREYGNDNTGSVSSEVDVVMDELMEEINTVSLTGAALADCNDRGMNSVLLDEKELQQELKDLEEEIAKESVNDYDKNGEGGIHFAYEKKTTAENDPPQAEENLSTNFSASTKNLFQQNVKLLN